MKCPKCGYEQAIYDDVNEWWHCPQCHGSGEVQMTEQEYIQTCNTEQLAEFLYDIAYFDNWSDAIMNDSLINETAVEDAIEMWLKQPHTTIKE